MRIILLLLLLGLLIISCKPTKETVQNPLDLQKQIGPDDIVFMLKKGGCYGTCPVYTFRIYNNRYAEFIGKQHTHLVGTWSKVISKDKYKSLKSAFDEANFLELEDNYKSNIPDLPLIKLSYHDKSNKKTVAGKRERPEKVHKLQFLLEDIAEAKEGWIEIEEAATPVSKDPVIDKTKIVLKIAKGNQLSKWFNEMKTTYGMQIISSMSNDNDVWLVGYNHKEHKAEEILAKLNDDPVVASAKFRTIAPEN